MKIGIANVFILYLLLSVACSGIGAIYPPMTSRYGHRGVASLRCASSFNTANDTATVQSNPCIGGKRASGRSYRLSPLAAIVTEILKYENDSFSMSSAWLKNSTLRSNMFLKNWSLSLALGEVVRTQRKPLCRPKITSTRNSTENPAFSRGHSAVKAEMIDVINCTSSLGKAIENIWFNSIYAHKWKSYCWSTSW